MVSFPGWPVNKYKNFFFVKLKLATLASEKQKWDFQILLDVLESQNSSQLQGKNEMKIWFPLRENVDGQIAGFLVRKQWNFFMEIQKVGTLASEKLKRGFQNLSVALESQTSSQL